MNSKKKTCLSALFVLFLLAACSTTPSPSAPGSSTPSRTSSPTQTASPSPSLTTQATRTLPLDPRQYANQTAAQLTAIAPTLTPSITPSPTPSPYIISGPDLHGLAGTPLPGAEPLTASNITRLARVARWGRGTISEAAYAPDGNSFVIGSKYGLALYKLPSIEQSPLWIEFETPFSYSAIRYSQDSQYLWLEAVNISARTHIKDRYYHILDLQQISAPDGTKWAYPNLATSDWVGDLRVAFPDGTKEFRSWVENIPYPEELDPDFSIFNFSRENYPKGIFDSGGNLMFKLEDKLPLVKHFDIHEPESCDVRVFSPCGNALEAQSMGAKKAGVSANSKYIAVVYQAGGYYDLVRLNFLRVYDSNNGKVLLEIGGSFHPVQDFALSPSKSHILVIFYDGDIQLWDIPSQSLLYQSWDFVGNLSFISESYNGEYLLIKRGRVLETRRALDGTLLRRTTMSAYAISPTNNLIALGHEDGRIDIQSLASGAILQRLTLHQNEIYSLVFSPDGQSLYSSSEDCTTRRWQVSSGQQISLVEQPTTQVDLWELVTSKIFIYYMKPLAQFNQMLGFGSWGRVVSWDLDSGRVNYVLEPQALEYYRGMMTVDLHFPEDLSIDEENQSISIGGVTYNLLDGSKISALAEDQYDTKYAEPLCYLSNQLSTDGQLRFTDGTNHLSGKICIQDASGENVLYTLPVNSNSDTWTFLSKDGTRLYVMDRGGGIFVYQVVP